MKKLLFLLLYLAILAHLSAQDSNRSKLAFNFGYFGETVTHPGMNLGIEYYPHQTKRHQSILAGSIGGYVHVRNNKAFFIRAQWGQRLHFKNGLFIDQFIGLGYLHQFVHGGELYEVKPNGAVIETPDSGQPMIMPSVSFGTGYSLNNTLSIYVRPELFWKAPFNGYYLTNLALNAGVIYKL